MRVLNGHLGGRQVLLVEKSEKYVERVYQWNILLFLECMGCIPFHLHKPLVPFFSLDPQTNAYPVLMSEPAVPLPSASESSLTPNSKSELPRAASQG